MKKLEISHKMNDTHRKQLHQAMSLYIHSLTCYKLLEQIYSHYHTLFYLESHTLFKKLTSLFAYILLDHPGKDSGNFSMEVLGLTRYEREICAGVESGTAS